MTMIPDAMRLPLTFGLSGALHAAALGFVPPPPLPSDLPSLPIQVRLLEGSAAQVAGQIPPGIPDVRTAQAPSPGLPQGRPASAVPSFQAPAALESPVAAAATPVAGDAPLPESVREHERHSGPSDSAALSPFGTAALSLPALASVVETRAAVVGSPPDPSGGDPQQARGVQTGTPASPFQAPKALHTPAPEYPEEARWEKRTGLATLGFRVEADGSVAEVRMLHSSGHADLDTAALESLRHWRFALPPGAAPSSWYRYVFRFELT